MYISIDIYHTHTHQYICVTQQKPPEHNLQSQSGGTALFGLHARHVSLPGEPISQSRKTTPDREQYISTWQKVALIWSCQRIWRSQFPLSTETQYHLPASCLWPLKPNHPNGTCLLLYKRRCRHRSWGRKSFQQQLFLLLWTNCSFTSRKCQSAFCQTNTAWLRLVTSPGEHLPASALRSSGIDLALTPLA